MTKSMPTGTDKQRLTVITCFAHHGYRRAGVSFSKGENTFTADDFSESQLAQLHDDPRLKLQFMEADTLQAKGSNVKTDEEALTVMSFAEAVLTLEHDNKDHFTGDGKPQCDVLSKLMSQPISASERDRLWAEHLQSNSLSTQAASQEAE